jgi:hypothetical protein
MTIEQFDKLQQLVERLITKYRQVNFQKIKLENENIELKKKLDLVKKINSEEELKNLEKIHLENERLKTKNSQVKSQLQNLLAQLEQKRMANSGVDS